VRESRDVTDVRSRGGREGTARFIELIGWRIKAARGIRRVRWGAIFRKCLDVRRITEVRGERCKIS
jgi:hypothetical protein